MATNGDHTHHPSGVDGDHFEVVLPEGTQIELHAILHGIMAKVVDRKIYNTYTYNFHSTLQHFANYYGAPLSSVSIVTPGSEEKIPLVKFAQKNGRKPASKEGHYHHKSTKQNGDNADFGVPEGWIVQIIDWNGRPIIEAKVKDGKLCDTSSGVTYANLNELASHDSVRWGGVDVSEVFTRDLIHILPADLSKEYTISELVKAQKRAIKNRAVNGKLSPEVVADLDHLQISERVVESFNELGEILVQHGRIFVHQFTNEQAIKLKLRKPKRTFVATTRDGRIVAVSVEPKNPLVQDAAMQFARKVSEKLRKARPA